MNLNKGCIEIFLLAFYGMDNRWMNLNKGCIEMVEIFLKTTNQLKMNLNKGCIEIATAQTSMRTRSG